VQSPPLLLGIDLGTSSVKVVLVTADGAVVASGSAEYPILHPQPACAEQEPAAWWQAVGSAVRQAMAAAPGAEAIVAVGLSGQMHGVVLLDGQMQPLANAVIWPDQRSRSQVQALTAELGPERLVELSGSPVATGFMAATLRWMREMQPALLDRATHALSPKDWLRWQMVGEIASDYSDGSGALLLDVRRRDWAPEILAAVGIDRSLLPPLRPAVAVAGKLTATAAAHLGLAAGTPVIVGAADTACGLLGAGAADGRTLVVNLSTGGQLVLPASIPSVDRKGRLHTFCSALEPGNGRAGWYLMGATLSVGMALRWLRDNVLAETGEDAYTRLTTQAAQAPIGAGGLLFLPHLVGERTPHMDPAARGAFIGLTVSHGRAHLIRSVIEGATFACADAYQVLLESALGATLPERVLLAGGGARSPLWQQIVADVLGVSVERLMVSEQSAMGAALLAGAGAGLFDVVSEASRWARSGPPVAPDPSAHARYQELLSLYREAWHCNQSLFHRLHALNAQE